MSFIRKNCLLRILICFTSRKALWRFPAIFTIPPRSIGFVSSLLRALAAHWGDLAARVNRIKLHTFSRNQQLLPLNLAAGILRVHEIIKKSGKKKHSNFKNKKSPGIIRGYSRFFAFGIAC
jgi:hypothetical protein